MKRMILLPIILGAVLSLTGCRTDDAESSITESAMSTTASETTLNVSTSDISDSSQMQETELQHSEAVVTEEKDMPSTADTPASEVKETSKNTGASDASVPQLETAPEDVEIEEDSGDFGELFS